GQRRDVRRLTSLRKALAILGTAEGRPAKAESPCNRASHMTENPCPVGCCAEIISGKWTLLLIRDLAEGSQRFCELERSLHGISPRTLSLRLRALEENGIVERRTYPEVPPRVEYALTDKGSALVPLIEDMRAYGRRGLLTTNRRESVVAA